MRPYLESDGGDIRLVEVTDDYVVKVKLLVHVVIVRLVS